MFSWCAALSSADMYPLDVSTLLLKQNGTTKTRKITAVRHRPEQNRVTWETPSSEAIPLLQEPIGLLASYAPHEQIQVWSEQVWLNTTVPRRLYFPALQ